MHRRKRVGGVLFDYGNTLLQYCDFSWDAFGARVVMAARALAEELKRDGLAGPEYQPDEWAPVWLDHLKHLEATAQHTRIEYDITSALHGLFAGRFPVVNGRWDAAIDRAVYGVMRQELIAKPGAVPLLWMLRARGLRVGLLSNTQFRSKNHLDDLQRDGLFDLLDARVFSVDVGKRKPDPEIFHRALKELRTDPEETVYVGDNIECDVDGARAVGMWTILVRTRDNASVAHPGADGVIDELEEIPALIDAFDAQVDAHE
jgi:HAD superfamily hydrolase (TIGR01662 family)